MRAGFCPGLLIFNAFHRIAVTSVLLFYIKFMCIISIFIYIFFAIGAEQIPSVIVSVGELPQICIAVGCVFTHLRYRGKFIKKKTVNCFRFLTKHPDARHGANNGKKVMEPFYDRISLYIEYKEELIC